MASYVHAFVACALAVLTACASVEMKIPFLGTFFTLCAIWFCLSTTVVMGHGHRVLARTWGTDKVSLRSGCFWLSFPEYVVKDASQFGPWSGRKQLPQVGQILDIDVPEVLVQVDHGVYCLRVNTKVIGVVEEYTVQELLTNPVAIEQRCHDVIAQTLRNATHDKPLEGAIVEIQRLFLKDASSISDLMCVPAFRPTQLLLDANQRISAADAATGQAMELVVQRKQEAAKRSNLEASMETEEQKVKLNRVTLQASRDACMLQQEAYGKEGAAMIEAAKHCKALYLVTGSPGLNTTVLSLPSV